MVAHPLPEVRPLVLHVSGDFPDPIAPFKTPVIRSFLDLTAQEFEHSVVSINRRSPGLGGFSAMLRASLQAPFFEARQFDAGTALHYVAPGRGVLHKTRLDLLGDWLTAHIRQMERQPDLLMAHKLTIEGIAVERAARQLGLPYALTIQGNTDRRILKARPDLLNTFRRIYRNAAKVLTFTPIALRSIEAELGKRSDGIRLIPCPTELDAAVPPRLGGADFISVFHLKNHKVKNLRGMAGALAGAPPRNVPDLSVIGGGTAMEMATCQKIARGCPTLTFEGPLDRTGVVRRMNGAIALVQPSLSESFGLVFIEALFAGLPIIYPSGTGIDGYFDGAEFALRADPRSPSSILEAMQSAVANEGRMKKALSHWQASDAARRFTRPAIAKDFSHLLHQALRNASPGA